MHMNINQDLQEQLFRQREELPLGLQSGVSLLQCRCFRGYGKRQGIPDAGK